VLATADACVRCRSPISFADTPAGKKKKKQKQKQKQKGKKGKKDSAACVACLLGLDWPALWP
jgi:hypothetical protein